MACFLRTSSPRRSSPPTKVEGASSTSWHACALSPQPEACPRARRPCLCLHPPSIPQYRRPQQSLQRQKCSRRQQRECLPCCTESFSLELSESDHCTTHGTFTCHSQAVAGALAWAARVRETEGRVWREARGLGFSQRVAVALSLALWQLPLAVGCQCQCQWPGGAAGSLAGCHCTASGSAVGGGGS